MFVFKYFLNLYKRHELLAVNHREEAQSRRLPVSPAELGVEGEFAWLPCEDALAALTAVLAAYMLASSWNLPMFFLYLILLFPNQLET